MINFCTLFNTNYLSRGLALHQSLKECCGSFHLYVVCFDDNCFDYLNALKLDTITAIRLKDFETKELLEVKPLRSAAEYCWTCTASVIEYCIEHYVLDACTYLDADLYFYENPSILIEEAKGKSVIITEHNYSKEYDQSITHGIYCVQFMYFKNNAEGMEVLKRWKNQCIEWCYDYLEDGKFGDQKYLDEWPILYPQVHVIENKGAGVAPWNLRNFNIREEKGKPFLSEKKSNAPIALIFFHFHGLKLYTNNKVLFSGAFYYITPEVKSLIYGKYINALLKIGTVINTVNTHLNYHGQNSESPSTLNYITAYMKIIAANILNGNKGIADPQFLHLTNHMHIAKLAIADKI